MPLAVRGETLDGKSVTVKSLSTADNVAGCHIIYFRASADRNMRAGILAAAKTLPILTIGESPDCIRDGGIICFTRAENRIRFEINPAAAEQRSISLSSRLLRLANIVGAQ